jgi:ADP-ribosylglycohydrolase
MEQYCMNLSTKQLEDLQLAERNSIGYTFKCLGSALLSFTRQAPTTTSKGKFFEKVITDLTLEAGDADTNCAVAGALLGARLGYNGLPKKWVDGLRHFAFLMELCDQMCEMVLKSFDEFNKI